MTVNHPDQFDGGASAFFPERLMNGRYVQPGGPFGVVISDQFIISRSFQPGFPCQPQQLQSDGIACAEYAAAGIPVQKINCCIQIRIGGSRPAALFQSLPESVPAQSKVYFRIFYAGNFSSAEFGFHDNRFLCFSYYEMIYRKKTPFPFLFGSGVFY